MIRSVGMARGIQYGTKAEDEPGDLITHGLCRLHYEEAMAQPRQPASQTAGGPASCGGRMNDHFPYIYEQGHWIRDSESDDTLTLGKVVETALCFFAMCAVLVLVMIGWLCG